MRHDKYVSCIYRIGGVKLLKQVTRKYPTDSAKRKSALVLDINQGKTTVSEASRTYDLSPSEVETWVDDAGRGMENALRANPLDIKVQYEHQLKQIQVAYG